MSSINLKAEHPYAAYESHRYWKRIEKAISDLVRNQDLTERTARRYIVGYICEVLLKPQKPPKKRRRA